MQLLVCTSRTGGTEIPWATLSASELPDFNTHSILFEIYFLPLVLGLSPLIVRYSFPLVPPSQSLGQKTELSNRSFYSQFQVIY
jgi:hypothetical protein